MAYTLNRALAIYNMFWFDHSTVIHTLAQSRAVINSVLDSVF